MEQIETEDEKYYSTCTTTDTSYQGKECYKVEERPPASVKLVPGVAVVVEFIIDKESFFLYSEKHFSSRGSVIYGREFSNVELNPTLNDMLFQLPPEVSVITANSADDFQRASMKTAQAMFPAPETAPIYKSSFSITNWFQRHFDFFLSAASWLLFVLGAGLLVFITIYKFKERYGNKKRYR